MGQELKNLLKKAPEWIKEKIQFAFSHGFTIDEKDYINAIKKEVGNSKTGNKKLKFTDKKDSLKEYIYDEETKDGYIYYDGKLVDTKKHVGSGWVDLIKQKAYASGVENSRTGNKAGNSTYTEADRKRLYELARKHNKTAQEWAEFDELNRKEEKASEELIKRIGKNKTSNYKTGTSKLKPGDKVESYGVKGVVKSIKGENEDNIYGEPLIEVEFNSGVKKVVPEHYLIKVGNASVSGGTFESEDGTKKAVVDIVNLQSGATRVVWMENGRQTGSNEYRNVQAATDACKRKGLKKVGNSDKWHSYDEMINKAKRDLEVIKQKEREATSVAKKQELASARREIEDKIKYYQSHIGNSASDDKFAYVMREFDEGKLKTPDGKVVTDPAQAKAIAYSESKKTENGLARARNAMACNKEITLWNGNDTALVKADGTVLYLESNSFETGRDKFDSQELAVKELAKNGYKSK